MECNQILNYISHRSINGSPKDLEVSKNIEDLSRDDKYNQMKPDIPSTRRYKVMRNHIKFNVLHPPCIKNNVKTNVKNTFHSLPQTL